MTYSDAKQAVMNQVTPDHRWVKMLGALVMAGLILAGCGQADRTTSGPATTSSTVPVTEPIATLPARVDSTVPTASPDGLVTVVDQVGQSVDELTAEVAAGRSDFASFVTTVETRIGVVRRAWADRAAEWEAAWDRAGREWHAEWDAYGEQIAEDWEQAREDAGR